MNDAQKTDDKFKLYTEDPSEVIYAIVSDAHTNDFEIISFMSSLLKLRGCICKVDWFAEDR